MKLSIFLTHLHQLNVIGDEVLLDVGEIGVVEGGEVEVGEAQAVPGCNVPPMFICVHILQYYKVSKIRLNGSHIISEIEIYCSM